LIRDPAAQDRKDTPMKLDAKVQLPQPIGLAREMAFGDAFFWYAEAATPQLRPLVAGLFLLDRAPRRPQFEAAIVNLIARVPRLRQRVVEPWWPPGLPSWEEDRNFDLRYHLREVVLPEPGNLRALLDLTGSLFATPIDHLRPLWEGYLVERLEGGRAAFFLKVHHAVMDGAGSVALFDALTQARRGEPIPVPPPATRPARPPGRGSLTGASRAASAAVLPALLLRSAAGAALDPMGTLETIRRTARAVRQIGNEWMVPKLGDPLVERATGVGRRLEILSLPLPRLRRIKRALKVTLNDLVLTIVCGALRGYYERRRLPLNDLSCQVPVSLRQDHERLALGNRVGAFTVRLPLREIHPLVRLQRIREQTARGKSEGHASATTLLMRAATLIPSPLLRLATESMRGRVHLICSNVPGPTVARYLAGAKVEAVYPFAPIMLGVPISIALVSYGSTLCIGLDSDPAAIPDPDQLRQLLEREVARVERLALPRPPAANATNDARGMVAVHKEARGAARSEASPSAQPGAPVLSISRAGDR
jgi:diacylglycerol O-acyltransferase